MQINSNLSCLPFYDSLEEQDFRKWYAYGSKYLNRVSGNYLIPFFFELPSLVGDSWAIDSVEFFKSCCEDIKVSEVGSFSLSFSNSFSVSRPLQSAIIANGLTIDDNTCIYVANEVTPLGLANGLYYIKINFVSLDEEREFSAYSDIFFASDSLAGLTKIEWYNLDELEYDGGVIPYEFSTGGSNFKNVLYLDTEIGKPTYSFTEEGEERNGLFFPTKQISEKTYNMGFYAPEYLCDVMRLIRMADVVRITDRLGRVYNVEQFEMDVDWMEQGHYASVDCSFQTNTVVKKVGKAY